jgi:O-antigen ligase
MPIKLNPAIHHKIYIWASCLMVIGLPLSPALITFSIIVLSVNWIAEADFKSKLSLLKHNAGLSALSGIYLLFLIGLLYTQNWDYALLSLKIKLPILILPIIYATQNSLEKKDIELILKAFLGSCLVAFGWSMYIYMGFTGVRFDFTETYSEINLRQLTPVISHIRYSALMLMAFFVAWYFFIQSKYKAYQYILFAGLFFYLIQLMSVRSSLLSLVLCIFYLLIYYLCRPNPIRFKVLIGLVTILSPFLIFYTSDSVRAAISEGMWELKHYFETGEGMGYSLSQRLEFWQYAFHIIKENMWIGVGTGDTIDAFKSTYQTLNPELIGWENMKAHNEYLTLSVTLGLLGLAAYFIFLLWGVIKESLWAKPLFMLFLINYLSSQFSDDNLDTQAGVMFLVVFFSLIFTHSKNIKRSI